MTEYIQAPFNKYRKDKFTMVIPTPVALKPILTKFDRKDYKADPETFSMSVYGVVAPSINIPAIINRYAGHTLKVSSHSRETYPELSVNFTVDNRFNNYWYIYKWLDLLNNDKTSIYDQDNVANVTNLQNSVNAKDGTNVHAGTYNKQISKYTTTVSIFALDEYEKQLIEFKYTNAFPTVLGGISMSYRDSGEAETTVDFAYSQFTASLVEQVESL